jgi:hypothetical protein
MDSPYTPPRDLDSLQTKAWTMAVLGIAAMLIGYYSNRPQFFQSYLVAWLFWLGIALGCFALGLLHQLTRGAWGLMLRRILGAATRTLPYLALGFIPIVIGIEEIFIWARPEAATDPIIAQKSWYLNRSGFILRGVLYFAVWSAIAWILNHFSRRQDLTNSAANFRRMQFFAGPGLLLYCLTASLASVDWLMSLNPHWYSSLFGISFIGGQAVAALAFLIPMALYLAQRDPMKDLFRPRHFHDYGKLLLAFVMLWTYFQLSQLIIVWSGNLPEEVPFYLSRLEGGWKWLTIALAIGHFALPFVLLLSRDLKRDAPKLARVALLLLVMRWLDIYWQAAPAFQHGESSGLHMHWLDFATVLGIGGLWFALYLGELKKRPLLPAFEPYLEEALDDE